MRRARQHKKTTMSVDEILAKVAASDMPLQRKLDAVRDEYETNILSPDAVAVMHRTRDDLIRSGQARRALNAGDRAPIFSLPDLFGKMVSSNDLLRQGALVLTFYRGAWCPYCAFDLEALDAAKCEFERRGAVLAAVSQQMSAASQKCRAVTDLGFPVLSDRGGLVAAQFGVRWTVPNDLRRVYKLLDADLEEVNGEASWTLSMPARYIIDPNGVIAFAELNPDYTVRSEPSLLFPVLDTMKSPRKN
jgi:peroxiredoxin